MILYLGLIMKFLFTGANIRGFKEVSIGFHENFNWQRYFNSFFLKAVFSNIVIYHTYAIIR